MQSRIYTEDTHTEQRIHGRYTYKADDSIHSRGCIFRENTQYTYRAETTNT
jgi:hypothetical protein